MPIHDDFPIVKAIMPHAGESAWTLPRLGSFATEHYPTLTVPLDGKVYLVAVIVQPKSLVHSLFETDHMLSKEPDQAIMDAKYLDQTQFAFFSEVNPTEWNPHALLYGETFEPLVAETIRRFQWLWGMRAPETPVVLYHGTTHSRASEIQRTGFVVSNECSRLDHSGAMAASDASEIKCTHRHCRCRMLGPGVYGT